MHIGLQKIPRRRVMNSVSNPGLSNQQHYGKNSHNSKLPYDTNFINKKGNFQKDYFGTDRKQLADFVMQELNQNHKDDADILQKFRRQAQQSKKRRFMAKRGQSNHYEYQTPQPRRSEIFNSQALQPQKHNQQTIKRDQHHQNYNFIDPRDVKLQKMNQFHYPVLSSQPQVVIIREPNAYPNNGKQDYLQMENKKLKKKLKERNQALRNAKKKIFRCQKYISEMKDQHEYDQQQRTVGKMSKVANMINEVCNKIQRNGYILNHSLIMLNDFHQQQSESRLPNSVIPIRKRANAKIASMQKFQYLPSAFQQKNPSVHYSDSSLPRQTKISKAWNLPQSNSIYKSKKNNIKQIYNKIQELKESRNRLDGYNFQQLQQ